MGHVGVQEALGMPQLECHLEPRLVELWWNPGWWNFGGTLVELWWNLGWWNPTLLEVELWWNIGGTLVEPGLVEPNLGGTRPAKKCIFLNCDPSPNCTPLGGHPWQGWPGVARTPKLLKTEFLIIQSFEMGHFGVEERLGSPRGWGSRGGQGWPGHQNYPKLNF